MLGQFVKNCTLWEGPTLEQFAKSCSPWEGLMLQEFVEGCLTWQGPHSGSGEECEGEGAAEMACDELTVTPIAHSPAPLAGKR